MCSMGLFYISGQGILEFELDPKPNHFKCNNINVENPTETTFECCYPIINNLSDAYNMPYDYIDDLKIGI